MGLFGGLGRRLKDGRIADGLAAAQAALAGDYAAMARINEMTRERRNAQRAAATSLHERLQGMQGDFPDGAEAELPFAVGGPADPARIGIQALQEQGHFLPAYGGEADPAEPGGAFTTGFGDRADLLPFGQAGLARPAAFERAFGGPELPESGAPGWRRPGEVMNAQGGPAWEQDPVARPHAWAAGYQDMSDFDLTVSKTMAPVEVPEEPAPPPRRRAPANPDPHNLGPPIVITGPRHRLGDLSKEYESGKAGPGTISSGRGDPGGRSYGVHQFSSRYEIGHEFVRSPEAKAFWPMFKGLTPVTEKFDQAWGKVAKDNPAAFEEAQRKFGKRYYLDSVTGIVRRGTGLDIDKMSTTIKDVVWSTANQHGENTTLVNDAVALADAAARKGGFTRGTQRYEEELINRIYDLRVAHFRKKYRGAKDPDSRRTFYNVFKNRLVNERKDALQMLRDRRGR